MNWRKIGIEKPKDQQECLVKMHRGIHQATYCIKSNYFSTYLLNQEISFYGREWVPIEELPGYQLNQK